MPEVPGYQMERRLGAGGMGVVLLARALDSGARRVIKVLAGSASAESRTRFEREARLLASIRHENIVGIHGVSETVEGRPCLILSHVEGETLHDLRRREGRLDGERVGELFESLASAIGAMHKAGVIHRDLKPENVMVESATGRLVLLDFGLARKLVSEDPEQLDELTKTGELVGTPGYMAPEQLAHKGVLGEVSEATDVWGLGATLFDALTGEAPVVGGSFVEIAAALASGQIRRSSTVEAATPPWLDRLCAACLRPEPTERPDLAEVQAVLASRGRQSLARSSRERRWLAGAGAAVLVLLVGVLAWAALRDREPPVIQLADGTSPRLIREPRLLLKGRVIDRSPAQLVVKLGDKEERIDLGADGRFRVRLEPPEGSTTVTLLALDSAGHASEAARFEVRCDTRAPTAVFEETRIIEGGRVRIAGSLSEESCVLRLGELSRRLEGRDFELLVEPAALPSPIVLEAEDPVGHVATLRPGVAVARPGSLTTTIQSLPEGGVVLIGPGRYGVQAEVRNRLRIVGPEGGEPAVLVGERDTLFTVRAGRLELENLTVEQRSKAREPAVVVDSGRLTLRGVTIRATAAVLVVGAEQGTPPEVELESCHFSSTEAGQVLQSRGRLRVDRCVFEDRRRALHEQALLDVRSNVRAEVLRSTFMGSKDYAIRAVASFVDVEMCRFVDTHRAALRLMNAVAVVEGCLFEGGNKDCLSCSDQSSAVVFGTIFLRTNNRMDPSETGLNAVEEGAILCGNLRFRECRALHLGAKAFGSLTALRLDHDTPSVLVRTSTDSQMTVDGEPVRFLDSVEPAPAQTDEEILARLGESRMSTRVVAMIARRPLAERQALANKLEDHKDKRGRRLLRRLAEVGVLPPTPRLIDQALKVLLESSEMRLEEARMLAEAELGPARVRQFVRLLENPGNAGFREALGVVWKRRARPPGLILSRLLELIRTEQIVLQPIRALWALAPHAADRDEWRAWQKMERAGDRRIGAPFIIAFRLRVLLGTPWQTPDLNSLASYDPTGWVWPRVIAFAGKERLSELLILEPFDKRGAEERRALVAPVALFGEDAVLLGALEDPDAAVRRRACLAFAGRPLPEAAAKALTGLAAGSEPRIADAARFSLAWHGLEWGRDGRDRGGETVSTICRKLAEAK